MKGKGKMAFTPEYVESLEKGQVFVFGSNLIGCHGGGASKMAMDRFGAVWGQAEGPQGRSYAIPVDIKGEAVENVSLHMIRHIGKFIEYAKRHQELFFLVPRIGCGAAGFDDEFMAPFFKDALDMDNVSLPKSFVDILKKENSDKKECDEQRIFNLIILDESGSMEAIEKQAVSGLNETFQTIANAQKEHQEQKHFISFVTFNSKAIRKIMDRKPIDSNKKLEWTDYHPDECTPLFDAMGQSINELKRHVNEKDVVLVTIITDGYENASRLYSGIDIKKLVSKLKEKGWVFAYIGTNQDVDAVADDMGIRSRMSYEYSDRGASDMFETEQRSKRNFYSRLHNEGRSFMMNENYDYFHSGDEDAIKQEAEPEKAPDIVWDVKDEEGNDAEEPQVSSDAEATIEEQEQPQGFWGRLFRKK